MPVLRSIANTAAQKLADPLLMVLAAGFLIALLPLAMAVSPSPVTGKTGNPPVSVAAGSPAAKPLPVQEIVYVVDRDKVLVIDPKTGKRLTVLKKGSEPQLAVSPDGRLLYLAEGPGLRMLETQGFRQLAETALPHRARYKVVYQPDLMAVSQDGARLYVVELPPGRSAPPYPFRISVWRTTDLKQLGQIALGDIHAPILWADARKVILGPGFDSRGIIGNLHLVVDSKKLRMAKSIEISGLRRIPVKAKGKLPYDGSNSAQARGGATPDGLRFYYLKDKDRGGRAGIDIVSGSPPRVSQSVSLKLPIGWQAGKIAVPKSGKNVYLAVGPFSQTSTGYQKEVWVLSNAAGKLKPTPVQRFKPQQAFSPMALSTDGRSLYLLNTAKATLTVVAVNPSTGRLGAQKTIKLSGAAYPTGIVPAVRPN